MVKWFYYPNRENEISNKGWKFNITDMNGMTYRDDLQFDITNMNGITDQDHLRFDITNLNGISDRDDIKFSITNMNGLTVLENPFRQLMKRHECYIIFHGVFIVL